MELREMIELAEKTGYTVRALAKELGVIDSNLTAAKHGRRGLPNASCGKLAEIIGIDRWTVVAASDLVTEKNEQRRAYLLPFVRHAAIVLLAVIATDVSMTSTSEAMTTAFGTQESEVRILSPRPAIYAINRPLRPVLRFWSSRIQSDSIISTGV
ncbi:hypothetical protein [Georgfuchsia toluolica]|uniref:hypothetical protein n=1 Tax=Georgfuchsia toluolica TaxID=424218 RepID=UPI001C72F334|nr:hypothetical protein [Georgfuchsia toluolica]